MAGENSTKRCFVIGPIGEPETDVRRKADWLLKGIVRPVLEGDPFEYEVLRADNFPEPGMITGQVITAVLEWDLVVADLTGANANAFYELALRHMAERPVIHMIEAGNKLPFDVLDYRTVSYSLEEYESIEDAKRQLRAQVEAVRSKEFELSNPVTKARGYQRLAQSSDSMEKMVADAMTKIGMLDAKVDQLAASSKVGGIRVAGGGVFIPQGQIETLLSGPTEADTEQPAPFNMSRGYLRAPPVAKKKPTL